MSELDSDYLIGRYLNRRNRFVMEVKLWDESVVDAYCPNTSRLIGLLTDGPKVLLTKNTDTERKTNYTIHAFRDNGTWVGIDAAEANNFFEKFLETTDKSPFTEWENWDREVTYESSQLDFCRNGNGDEEWVEVKSLSSRTPEGCAFYSGTPSKRGYRHLDHLGELAEAGEVSRCVFVVQRSDVESLRPADVTQADWLNALREASKRGVDIRAYRCEFDGESWRITSEIPTYL